MTDQNNAAQPLLTDLELIDIGAKHGRPSVALLPMWRAVEAAVLSKLRAEGVQAGEPTTDAHTAFATWWNDQDEGSIRFDLEQYPQDLKATFNNLWNEAWRAALASAPEADSTLPFEQALYELVNKIDPGLDTGDLLQDAQRASAALGVIMASAPVASAEVMDALNWVDDFIARCNRDDRGSCDSVNVLRRALAAPPNALNMRKRYAP